MRVGATDTRAKEYLSDPVRFSDIFNFWLYDGRNVIRPEGLKEMDTTAIALPYGSEAQEPVQKFRDVLKLYAAMKDDRAIYLVLGLEEQTKVHYAMPVRGMLYDAMNYAKQVSAAATAHRREKDKLTEEEFLSGFSKADRLMPVITLTVSLSPDEWDGPTSLHEMLAIEDKSLLDFIPDYKLNLLTPQQIADADFSKFHTEVGVLMQCIKHRYDKGMGWMSTNERFMNVSRSTASLVKDVTGFDIRLDEEGDVVNMLNAWENSMNQARVDGEEKGKESERVISIRNLMETLNLSAKQAMDALKIPASEQKKYSTLI